MNLNLPNIFNLPAGPAPTTAPNAAGNLGTGVDNAMNKIKNTGSSAMDHVRRLGQQYITGPFERLTTPQKVLVIGLISAIVVALALFIYKREEYRAQSLFAKQPVFFTELEESSNAFNATDAFSMRNPLTGQTVNYIPNQLLDQTNPNEFTYSVWLYVNGFNPSPKGGETDNDWGSVGFGRYKYVLCRGMIDTNEPTYPPAVVYPAIMLDPTKNIVYGVVSVRNRDTGEIENNSITLDNFPFNQWFHVSLVLNETALNIYLNAELKSSISLNGPVNMSLDQPVTPLMAGGFAGNIAFLTYTNAALLPNQIRTIYDQHRGLVEKAAEFNNQIAVGESGSIYGKLDNYLAALKERGTTAYKKMDAPTQSVGAKLKADVSGFLKKF